MSHSLGPGTSLRHQLSLWRNLRTGGYRKGSEKSSWFGHPRHLMSRCLGASVLWEPSVSPASDPLLISVVKLNKGLVANTHRNQYYSTSYSIERRKGGSRGSWTYSTVMLFQRIESLVHRCLRITTFHISHI